MIGIGIGMPFEEGNRNFSPSQIQNLKLWVEGDSESNFIKDGSNAVSTWFDKSQGLAQSPLFATYDFTSGWLNTANATVNDANTFTTSDIGGVFRNTTFTVGKVYKVTASITSTGIPKLYTANETLTNVQAITSGVPFVALYTRLYIRNDGAGVTNLNSLQAIEILGNHLQQTATISKPLLVDLNNRKSVEFDGNFDFMTSPTLTLDQPSTVWILFKHKSYSESDAIIFDGLSNNSLRFAYSPYARNRYYLKANVGMNSQMGMLSDFNLIEIVYNGANSKLKINGCFVMQGDAGVVNTTAISLGASYAGGSPANISVPFMCLKSGVASSFESYIIENYISRAYTPKNGNILVGDGNSLMYGLKLNMLSNYTKFNYGVSGQTTTQMSSDASSQIDPFIRVKNGEKILVAWEILNEIAGGSLAKEVAYYNFVNYCLARKSAGWKVAVLTVISCGSLDAAKEVNRTWINEQLRANYLDYADVLIDVASDSRFTDYTNTIYYLPDQTHLTTLGYSVVDSLIESGINQ